MEGGWNDSELAKLTPRQRRFVLEYAKDLNGAGAAVRAGYSKRTANRIASEVLRHPRVAAVLAEHATRAGAKLELTVARIERELACVAYFDLKTMLGEDGQLLPIAEMPEAARRAIAGIEVEELWAGRGDERAQIGVVRKVRFNPKVPALELALKRLGALTEKHELVGPTSVTINIGVKRLREG